MKKITLLIIVSLLSFCGYAQLPNESFDAPWIPNPDYNDGPGLGGDVPAAGWIVRKQTPAVYAWQRNESSTADPSVTGTGFAYIRRQPVCASCEAPKSWLVTKAFPMPANGQLKFFSKLGFPGVNNAIYKIKIFQEGPGKDPYNFDDYTDIVTYTDETIQQLQLSWTQKVINMPNITGNVRIAFVLESNEQDAWRIDDVSCLSICTPPTGVTATNPGMTTIQLGWTSTSDAQQWEINVVPESAGGPSANWVTYNGAPPYVYGNGAGETLTADTDYKVYLRAVCSDSGLSDNTNPVFFSTAALGESCSNPLVIPSALPYFTTSNTSAFANNYNASGSTGCNTTGNYLQGNDVVYQYTPDATGNINIKLTGTAPNAGVFVYSDCANIGVSCLAGATGNGTVEIPTYAVTAGTPIYIVISSSGATAVTAYNLSVQQIFCDAPTAATVTSVSSNTANLSWAEGVSTEWQITVQPAGTGFPTVAGQVVTSATPSVTQTTGTTPVNLSASTAYEYYVRAKCTSGDTYSIWVGPIAFTTTQNPALLNYTEDFTTVPSQWTLNNGSQANKWAINGNATIGNTNFGGTGNALFISNDNGLNNLFTTSTQSVVQAYRDVTIPGDATSLNLSFDWKSNGTTSGGYFRVYLAPTTLTLVPGQQIANVAANIPVGGNRSGSPAWSTASNVITLPTGVAGSTRRLVFEWFNNSFSANQPPAAIDNINLSVITCPAPGTATLVAGTLQPTEATFTWPVPTSIPAAGYEVYIGPSPTAPVSPVNGVGGVILLSSATNTLDLPVNTLTPSQSYYVWVRANCGPTDKSTWSGVLFFVAPQIPAGMDYTQNFDGATHEWGLSNGTQANKWAVGTATSNSGTKSLYISSDNGTTNSYNVLATSTVHAYRDIQMPTPLDQLELSFDWKGVGEASDYFRVWLVNTDFTPTPGSAIGTANTRLLIPATATSNNFTGQTAWTNFKYIIQGSTYAGTTKRLVFEWINNNVNGSNPPAAIDNINLKVVQCPQPTALVLASLAAEEVKVGWTAPVSGATAYEYYYSTDATPPTATPPAADLNAETTTEAVIDGADLTPSTTYYFWVRTNCGATKSYWTGPLRFVTPQIPAPMDYAENFDGATNGYQFVNEGQVNKWVVGTATNNSVPNSLYISNDNGANNSYTGTAGSVVHAYRDIKLPAVVQDVQFTFDWKGTGEFGDYLKVWMVPVDYVPTPGTQITQLNNSRIQIGGQFMNNAGWKTENFIFNVNQFQGQARRLVFEWTNDQFGGTQRPAAVDNVNLAAVTCYPPSNLTMPSNNAGGATFAWTAPTVPAAGYDYYYTTSLAAPTSTTTPSNPVAHPTTSITLAGLEQSSNYYFWVRSNCGSDGKSIWIGPVELNTAQQASTLPYVQNFDGIQHGWSLKNGSEQDKWVVGTAVSNSPDKSLYISNTNGETNTYGVNGSVVHAYKDFVIPSTATSLDFSFDWKNNGDGFGDYVRVWRVPTTYFPTTGNEMSLPADSELITNINLQGRTTWTSASFTLDPTGYAGTNQRIIFEWVSNTFTANQAPAAIDNIDLQVVTCAKPTALDVTDVTSTGATFNWNEEGTATSWEIYVTPTGQPSPTAATTGISVTSTDPNPQSYVYTTPNLLPSTSYGFFVRSICDSDDMSKWAGPFEFKTDIANDECSGAYALGVNDKDNPCQVSATTSWVDSTPSSQPYTCTQTNGADIWYEFVATGERHNIELSDFAPLPQNVVAMPIVISLYEGTNCDILQPLGCSIVNVLQARNLVPGVTYKVRLSMNSATPNLAQTSFKVCINTPKDLGTVTSSACAVTTINADFEDPRPAPVDPPSPYPNMVHHNTVQGWRTTASDGIIEVWPASNFENVPDYDGGQFVELNANENAGLYQDYSTPQVTTFTYKFAHRGRSCVDKIELRAGNAETQDPKTLPLITVQETGFTGDWAVYTGTYTSEPGVAVTRFFFNSASSCGGAANAASIGNFLDGIEFTADNSIVTFGPEELTCVNNVITAQASGSGEWSADSSNPSETEISDPSNPSTSITGFSRTGDYKFYWTTLYCQTERIVHYDNGDVPAPAATTQIDYCLNETPVAITATALTGHTLNWYTTATGGTADATAPTPTATAVGTTTYYVSQTAPDSCESPRTAIAVTVHAIPTAPIAATTYTYCQDATPITLTATVFTGNTLNWYEDETGGTASTTAPTPSTAVPGTFDYFVSQTTQFGCESNRTKITIVVNPSVVPVTTFTLPASVCIEDPNPTVTPDTTQTPGGYYTAGGGLIIDRLTGEIDLTQSTPGTYTVTYTVDPDLSVCNKGNATSVQIVVTPLAPAVTGFTYTTPACADAPNQLPALATDFSTGGVFSSTTGLVIDPATGEINFAASTTGTYTVTYNFTGNVADCTADGTGTFDVTIVPVFEPVVEFSYATNYCYDSSDVTPDLDPAFTTGGTFSGTPGLVIDPVSGTINVEASTPGEHTVTYTFNADTVNCIKAGLKSDTFTIGTDLQFVFNGECNGSAFIVTAAPSEDGTYEGSTGLTFQWTTSTGTPVGTNSYTFDVSEYANSTPGQDVFPQEFLLTITDANGCETTRNHTVLGIGCSIQKGISPNNDGLNDYFDLEYMGVKKLSIFNRYGQEVYTKANYTREWIGQGKNGDELPTGTYYYVIERSAGGTNTGWIYINREE